MCLFDLTPCELVLLAAAALRQIKALEGQDFSKEELTILAAFFTALGDNFALLST